MLPAETIWHWNTVQTARHTDGQTDDREGIPKGQPVYTGDATTASWAEANTSFMDSHRVWYEIYSNSNVTE